MRAIFVIIALITAGLCTQCDIEGREPSDPIPKFTFVKSDATGKHIAVQPKEEHHRIYFPLSIEKASGKTAFAKIRCKAEGEDAEVEQTTTFKVKSDAELWRVYLRAPRYADKTATYQVEVGIVNSAELDPNVVLGAFAWQVQRKDNQAIFTTEIMDGAGKSKPITIPRSIRIAVIQGGKIVIVSKYVMDSNPDIIFGLDKSNNVETEVTGSGAINVKR